MAQPPPSKTAPKSTAPKGVPVSSQHYLDVAQIRDGVVVMKDGSMRAIVLVNAVNFALKSEDEQNALVYSYQGFLNSFSFPIQIVMQSRQLDLANYIQKLQDRLAETTNELVQLQITDYMQFIGRLIQIANIMDKKFYLVIPFFPVQDVQKALTQSKNFFAGLTQLFNKNEDHVVINESELEKAKTELRNRVQAVLGGLQQCNIQGLPLDTQELIELYYDTYNPDTATRQQLKNFNDLTADIVIKGNGMAQQAHLQRELQ